MENVSITGNYIKRNFLFKTGNFFLTMGRRLILPSTIVEIICALLTILFIYTGLNKYMDYSNFKFQLGRSPFLEHFSGGIAVILPGGELLISIALILRKTRLLGLYLSYFLMSLFTGYIWIMLYFSFDLPCSCGGILAAMSWKSHLIFNISFTCFTIIGILFQARINIDKLTNNFNIDNR